MGPREQSHVWRGMKTFFFGEVFPPSSARHCANGPNPEKKEISGYYLLQKKKYLRVPPSSVVRGVGGGMRRGGGTPGQKGNSKAGGGEESGGISPLLDRCNPPKKMPGRQANKIQGGKIKLFCHSVLLFLEKNWVFFHLANKVPYLANHPVDFACSAPPQGRERLLFAPLPPPVME